jgi:hypothetical protein
VNRGLERESPENHGPREKHFTSKKPTFVPSVFTFVPSVFTFLPFPAKKLAQPSDFHHISCLMFNPPTGVTFTVNVFLDNGNRADTRLIAASPLSVNNAEQIVLTPGNGRVTLATRSSTSPSIMASAVNQMFTVGDNPTKLIAGSNN